MDTYKLLHLQSIDECSVQKSGSRHDYIVCCLDICIDLITNTDVVHMYWFSRDGYHLPRVMCLHEPTF